MGGIDQIDAGGGVDEVYGGADPDEIFGSDGDDFLVGGPGNDMLYGDVGNDMVWGQGGAEGLSCGQDMDVDTVDGGGGRDPNGDPWIDFLHPSLAGTCENVTRVEVL